MTMRELENAGALSEFVSGFTGDCGECAELCALHVVNPARYPLDAAALSAIVHRDISQGWASSNGAEPLSSIARDLAACGESVDQDIFSQPLPFNLEERLNEVGGIHPVIIELALAGQLPGDETGVHYHFITCLGWDTYAGVGIFADGDNAAVRVAHNLGPAGLVRYSVAQLNAAQPCGVLVLHAEPPEVPPPPPASTQAGPSAGLRSYVVVSGDTLSGIAAKLGLDNWYHALYQPNMATIEAAARAHGHPDSGGGSLIYPGETLHYQPA